MKNAVRILGALAVALSLFACANASSGTTTATTTNVGKVIKGNLYIDNVRFLDSSGNVLGTFDSFENFSSSNILCGGSAVDVWEDLKTEASAWGGQTVVLASSTLHATDGTHSLLIPVDMTISSTDADNFQWIGINWATSTSTGVLLPDALSAAFAGTAKIEFDYYWAPDSSSTVSSSSDLKIDGTLEWNNAAWTVASTTNSKGSSANLSSNSAGTGTIALDTAVGAGATQSYEIGLAAHYDGSLD
jgi:hypothetical protein